LPMAKSEGSIMNKEVIKQVKKNYRHSATRLGNEFRIHTINTSSTEMKNNPKRTVETVTDIVLTLIEEQLKEEILVLPKVKVAELFSGRNYLTAAKADSLVKLFSDSGKFRPREDVEQDAKLVQALPIVVVRKADGAVLRLRRRERSEKNPLHKKIVTWAGGHVRREDATDGNAIIQCAIRELKEELRLSIKASDLRLAGAIYIDAGERISKHMAIAYEWRAKTNDVAVVLSRTEFFEKIGTSLSGSFTEFDHLIRDVESKKISDPWSVELLRECLVKEQKWAPIRHFPL